MKIIFIISLLNVWLTAGDNNVTKESCEDNYGFYWDDGKCYPMGDFEEKILSHENYYNIG